MTLIEHFNVDNFDVFSTKLAVCPEPSFTGDKSMITCNDNGLYKTVRSNRRCKVFNITEVSSDSIADDNAGGEDFKGWKGFEGGQ